MISPKRPPSNIKDAELSRIIQDIYGILNELIAAVNQPPAASGSTKPDEKEGTVRIIKKDDETQLEIKMKDGWVQTKTGTFERKD